jgi:large subunit ribosomal protein L25
MFQQVALNAVTGREIGSSSSRRLRREGRIPAVVYGLESEPVSVSVNYSEARTALSGSAGLNALLNLTIDGADQLCLVKDIQRHVVRDEVSHIDFIRVDPNANFELEVPLILIGESKAVANVSGMVDQALFSVVISTKPTSIPNEIEVDISDMEVGDSIRVEDLKLPEGVEAAMSAETTVATAVVTRSTLEAMRADDAAEAAESEEGAAAPAGDSSDD